MNYDLSIHTNPDANAWAKFFMQTMKENPNIVLDETLMVGWFANAMMAMHDHLQGGGPINGDHAQHLVDSQDSRCCIESLVATGKLVKTGPMEWSAPTGEQP